MLEQLHKKALVLRVNVALIQRGGMYLLPESRQGPSVNVLLLLKHVGQGLLRRGPSRWRQSKSHHAAWQTSSWAT